MAEVAASVDELYPDLRGEPMENTQQYWSMHLFAGILDVYYEHRGDDAYVACDTLIYYQFGDPTKKIVPDVYVLFGVPGIGGMGSYKVWEIGKAPDFVLEVASPSTKHKDRFEKPSAYAEMGVQEYWRFDPQARYTVPLAGYQLASQGYEPIPIRLRPNGLLAASSEVLGLTLGAERYQPGFREKYGRWALFPRDRVTDEKLPDHAGEKARADAAEAQRDAERDRAEAAEAEVRALKAALAASRGPSS